jgi:hypothetical protein
VVPASVEELAYFEAVRAIEEQSSVLASLQTRAGTLLAASSLVTSFLGGRALSGEFHFWSILALGAFVATSLLTVGVLWPRHRWRFVVSPARLIAAARAEPADDDVAKAHEEVGCAEARAYARRRPNHLAKPVSYIQVLVRLLDRRGRGLDSRARLREVS